MQAVSTSALSMEPDAVASPRGRGARWVDAAAGLTAAAMVVIVLVQVVSRLRGAPVAWSEELTRALFIWMIYLGLASSMRAADAARVTVLMHSFRWLRPLALPVYAVTSVAFFALMAWTGATMVRQQFAMGETIATLNVPSWIIGLVMPVSASVALLGTLASLRDMRASIAVGQPVKAELEVR